MTDVRKSAASVIEVALRSAGSRHPVVLTRYLPVHEYDQHAVLGVSRATIISIMAQRDHLHYALFKIQYNMIGHIRPRSSSYEKQPQWYNSCRTIWLDGSKLPEKCQQRMHNHAGS
jgi:hypothetical protein